MDAASDGGGLACKCVGRGGELVPSDGGGGSMGCCGLCGVLVGGGGMMLMLSGGGGARKIAGDWAGGGCQSGGDGES